MRLNISTIGRKNILLALCFAGALQAAHAEYPEKPVRWIIPGAAGGAADATARIIANAVSARWGQPIVIDNRPGATGTIGWSVEEVALVKISTSTPRRAICSAVCST